MGGNKSALSVALAGALGVIAALLISSCGDETEVCDFCPQAYLPQTSPENVLVNLQTSYVERNITEYGKLLATDFRFYFDEGTRQQNSNLPVFWTADTDSAQTGLLFGVPEITDIRILLQYEAAHPVRELGRENWIFIQVLDTFIEVDLAPLAGEPEGYTFRIDGQQQRFYFRKGRTPEDTSSEMWYLVEWRDYGMQALLSQLQVEQSTWGKLKSLFRR